MSGIRGSALYTTGDCFAVLNLTLDTNYICQNIREIFTQTNYWP